MQFKKTAKVIIFTQLLLAVFCFAQSAYAEDRITNFESVIKVQTSGVIDVTEKITYDFRNNPSMEISRDIPIVLSNASELAIQVTTVTDEKGNEYTHTENLDNNIFHIQINNPGKTFEGVKIFIIHYKVNNAIGDYQDDDKLYFKIDDQNWNLPGSKIKVITDLSELKGINMGNVTPRCIGASCTFDKKDSQVIYYPFISGAEIALFIPNGYIDWPPEPPIEQQSLKDMFSPHIRLVIGMLLFGAILGLIKRLHTPKNDTPRQLRKRPIITEYEPPQGLSPIEAGTIMNRFVDNNDVSSVIMDLALKGYMKIDFTDGTNFIKLRSGDDLINPADKEIFQLLFQNRNQVSLSSLKKSPEFVDSAQRIALATEEYLSQNGYIYKFAKSKFKKFEIPLGIIAVVALMTMYFSFMMIITSIEKVSDLVIHSTTTFVFIISFIVCIASGYVYRKMTVVLTDKGIEVYAKLLGFKKFLQMTEKDRLAFFNAPESKPEEIEKFLPYAMVLHVENKWSKVFEELYHQTSNDNNTGVSD